MSATPRISSRIRHWRRLQWSALLLRYLLRVFAFGLILLCLYAGLDVWRALPSDSRITLNLLLPAGLVVAALSGLRAPGSLRETAALLDRFRRDRRKSISCALDLERIPDQSALQSELRLAALREGETQLKSLPLRAVMPWRTLSRLGALAVLAAAMVFALAGNFPGAASTVWARLRDPRADIAPWTSLKFHLSPESPSVLYGGDLQVSLQVEGDMPDQPVLLLTRIDGEIRETPSYRESGQRFSQRLEQVTQPVDFAFAVGRLRSDWKTVDLQLLPKIVRSEIRLTPPAYSGRPATKYAFGSRTLKGLPGTEMELTLESNRPLADGSLILKRAGEPLRTVSAEIEGNRARFAWELDATAGLEIQIRDLLGNAMAAPLESHQQLTPDHAPEVRLNHPQAFMLATPKTVINLKGTAVDDVGISRVTLIRGMPGYVDRAKLMAEGPPRRRWTVESTLDLAAIGVEPGQTLEFYLEAVDHRPGGGRTGVSPLSRVQIITEAEYAANLRRAEQLAGFQERFVQASAAIQNVRSALDALQAEIDGNPTQTSLKEALRKAAAASRHAEEVFRRQAEDFPIFDLEEKAQQKLEDLRDHFGEQAESLENLDPNDMALDLKVARITGAQQAKEEEIRESGAEAERFIQLGRLLEQTARYQELVERQALLVRWFERYAYALPEEGREMLRTLGDYQQDLHTELQAWIRETRSRAEDLGAEDAEWAREVEEMLWILERNQVEEGMKNISEAAWNEKNREALRLAREVLAGMRTLEPPPPPEGEGQGEEAGNTFCRLCMGGGAEGPGAGSGGLSDSLQQLLDALRSRGDGSGRSGRGGQGGGIGGAQDDGYWTRGSSPLHLPMQGPRRDSLDKPYGMNEDAVGGSGSGSGDGSTAPGVSIGHRAGSSAKPAEPVELILEKSPPQYRGAIRQFFDLNPENPL